MDYSKTLNLPEIGFPVKPDPTRTELEILSFWEDLKPYEKRQRCNKANPGFIIHSPLKPVNEHIYLDDVLDMVLKDITVKYKLMRGFNAPSFPGWNSYTSSIEQEALQFLEDKGEVQESELQKHCRELCTKYVDIQKEQYQRLGIFAYWDKAVLSSDSSYGSGMIRAFADLYRAGYLYKGIRPTRWCINCQTDLAQSEVEYKNHKLLSLYVKFPVINGLEDLGEDVYMVVWTNTPWTLPANTAIKVHPDYDYVAIEVGGKEVLIVAAEAKERVTEKIQGTQKVVKEMKGLELDKILYAHPFLDRNSDVFLDRGISLDRGTGCVHTVPEFGQSARTHQNDTRLATTVDQNGQLTEEAGQFCGLNVFDSTELITLELEKRGCLLTSELMEQPYPHCLYCERPTIVRTANKWILNLNANDLRQRALKAVEELDWTPEWGKNKFSEIIANQSDWSISRQRVWGIPAPIYYCKKCDSQVDPIESINSSIGTIGKRGFKRWITAKPNDVLSEGGQCSRCGEKDFRRETEMLDARFLSAMSYKLASLNSKSSEQDEDICLVGKNQSEKWIQFSLLPSIAIEDSSPFKSVLMHDVIVDKSGKKLSEFKDSEFSIESLLENFGAEVMRLWVTSMDSRKRIKASHSHFEVVSKTHQQIRNTCRFLMANISGYNPENDRVGYAYLQEIDRWALHRLAKLIEKTTKAFEDSQFHRFYHLLSYFCSVDMSSLYLNIVKRRLYASPKWSSSRRAAQTVIYEIITALARLMAPVFSFTAEEIWRELPATEEDSSIFLSPWPDVDETFLDDELESRWNQLLKIRSEIYRSLEGVRQEEGINNSSQVSVILYSSSEETQSLLDRYIDDLADIFMVSKVRLTPPDSPVPDGVQESDNIEGLAIELRRIAGEKCERCWIYSDTVGTNEQYPNLCYQCIAILEGGTNFI